jgi:hypothetical protein
MKKGIMNLIVDELNKDKVENEPKFERCHSEQYEIITTKNGTFHNKIKSKNNNNDLNEALNEYDLIIKNMSEEYKKENLTVDIIREEHFELNFMDDEEIKTLINYANQNRSLK